jgi:methylglutaconyl-CoA hydratase
MRDVEVKQDGSVLTIALNRPETHNAMTPDMIQSLITIFRELPEREDVHVVVLTGNGRSFCAGADLNYMRAAADYDFADNVNDGEVIFDLMQSINECPKPVVGRVMGAIIGGGMGLVSCCDIVVAAERATFGFSEVRLGILPAVISPFVLAKIGMSNGRQLFLTGERFNAPQALACGLVHHVVPEDELDAKVTERVQQLLQAAPGAQAAGKKLFQFLGTSPTQDEIRAYTANLIANRRASDEGKEGMSAFLQKRPPHWQASE